MRPLKITKLFVCILLGILCPTAGSAQNTTGSIVGKIEDASGAVLSGVKVQIRNSATAEMREVSTAESGDYTAKLLQPGVYEVTVSAQGFKTAVRSNIILQVDQTVRADFGLSVGSTSETVQVSAQALSLDTDSSSVGEVIVERQITELPLNGRNFTDLLFLTAGAVQTTGEQSTFRYNSGDAIAIAGARSSSNGYTIDGTTIMDTGYNTPAYQISLDAIQEFKVQTKTYSAEYGYSVNQINMSTKSGSNSLHGSVFEYLRNNALDARDYFNRRPQPVNALRQNQFGYSLGGPVFIPKIYDGRNRTFFFANYEGQRIRQSSTVQGIVPTPAELQGQFPFPINDPLTGQPFPQQNGIYTIPADRVSRYGQIIQKNPTLFFPEPNATGTFNFVGGIQSPVDADQQNYRLDQKITKNDSIFFHAAKSDITATVPSSLTAISDTITSQDTRNYTITYTHLFTTNLINQVRYGYLEALSIQNPFVIAPSDLQFLGLQGTFRMPNMGYPGIQFGTQPLPNASTPYTGSGSNGLTPLGSLQGMNDFSDSISWSKGKHSIGAGFQFRSWGLSLTSTDRPLGSFSHDGEFSGNQIADLLLGNPNSVLANVAGPLGNIAAGVHPHFHFKTWAPYVQDDWKATPRLTLNIGLRYEYSPGPYEEQNDFFWFNPDIPGGGLYVGSKSVAEQYGGGFYGFNGLRGPGPTPKNGFAPRVGFALRPFSDNKTVIRGGYGLFFDTQQLNEYFASGSFWPYGAADSLTASPAQGTLISTDNLYPDLGNGPVTKAALSFLEVQPANIRNPYVQDWSFGVQRELIRNTTLDVTYTGNKGNSLMNRRNPNQPTQCNAAHNCDPLNQTPATVTARTPYQNVGIVVLADFNGFSNYHALDVKLEHRGTDLSLLAAYTWSKGLDTQSSTSGVTGDTAGWIGVQDNHNPRGDYARASYDVGQRLALSFVYDLPVGRGKRFVSSSPPLVDAILGGWQVNGIATFQGGFPFSIAASDLGFVNQAFAERANKIGDPYPSGFHKGLGEWFNTVAFAQPAPGEFGNSSRNVIRGPGINSWNLSLFKNFRLSERARLQFRLESFNAFNHPHFGIPDQNVNSGTFGVISTLNAHLPARRNQIAVRVEF